MEPIVTPEVLFAQAGIAADADASAMHAELARRGWETRVAGPLVAAAPVIADRYRAIAVRARGGGRRTDSLRHPRRLERTAASAEVALRGVLATVLALEFGAAAGKDAF
jgi:hypothetical protein